MEAPVFRPAAQNKINYDSRSSLLSEGPSLPLHCWLLIIQGFLGVDCVPPLELRLTCRRWYTQLSSPHLLARCNLACTQSDLIRLQYHHFLERKNDIAVSASRPRLTAKEALLQFVASKFTGSVIIETELVKHSLESGFAVAALCAVTEILQAIIRGCATSSKAKGSCCRLILIDVSLARPARRLSVDIARVINKLKIATYRNVQTKAVSEESSSTEKAIVKGFQMSNVLGASHALQTFETLRNAFEGRAQRSLCATCSIPNNIWKRDVTAVCPWRLDPVNLFLWRNFRNAAVSFPQRLDSENTAVSAQISTRQPSSAYDLLSSVFTKRHRCTRRAECTKGASFPERRPAVSPSNINKQVIIFPRESLLETVKPCDCSIEWLLEALLSMIETLTLFLRYYSSSFHTIVIRSVILDELYSLKRKIAAVDSGMDEKSSLQTKFARRLHGRPQNDTLQGCSCFGRSPDEEKGKQIGEFSNVKLQAKVSHRFLQFIDFTRLQALEISASVSILKPFIEKLAQNAPFLQSLVLQVFQPTTLQQKSSISGDVSWSTTVGQVSSNACGRETQPINPQRSDNEPAPLMKGEGFSSKAVFIALKILQVDWYASAVVRFIEFLDSFLCPNLSVLKLQHYCNRAFGGDDSPVSHNGNNSRWSDQQQRRSRMEGISWVSVRQEALSAVLRFIIQADAGTGLKFMSLSIKLLDKALMQRGDAAYCKAHIPNWQPSSVTVRFRNLQVLCVSAAFFANIFTTHKDAQVAPRLELLHCLWITPSCHISYSRKEAASILLKSVLMETERRPALTSLVISGGVVICERLSHLRRLKISADQNLELKHLVVDDAPFLQDLVISCSVAPGALQEPCKLPLERLTLTAAIDLRQLDGVLQSSWTKLRVIDVVNSTKYMPANQYACLMKHNFQIAHGTDEFDQGSVLSFTSGTQVTTNTDSKMRFRYMSMLKNIGNAESLTECDKRKLSDFYWERERLNMRCSLKDIGLWLRLGEQERLPYPKIK